MTKEDQAPQKQSFGRRMWLAFKNLFWFVFRLLLIVLVIAALGLAIYLGGPILIEEYLLKDVRVNSSAIEAIQTQVANSNDMFSERLGDFQGRIDNLELTQDDLSQMISEFEAQLAAIETELTNQEENLDTLETQVVMIENLESPISVLLTQVPAINSDLEGVQAKIDNQFAEVVKTLEENQAEIETINAQLEAKDALDHLRNEIKMLKVMELITRARVSIGQENIGLVRDDLQAAIDILVDLGPEVTAEQASYLDDISQRLSFAIENISESPDLVDEDLEVAWQMLLKGLPDETDGIEEGKTQEQLEEGDQVSTPSPSPTNTPTPTLVIPGGQEKLTLSPSPTPTATVTPTPTEKP